MSNKYPADVSLLRILREKSKGTVCIFEKQDFTTIYDDDAMLVAREIFKSEVGVKRIQIGEKRIPYISLGGGQYERVVRELLIVLRYRVQLYKSVNNTWQLKCTGTAGNMEDFEEIGDLGREAASLSLVSICFPRTRKLQGNCYAAIIDPSTLRITHATLEDEDDLSHLEQCVISTNAKEAIIVGGDPPSGRLMLIKNLLRRSNIMCTVVKPKPSETSHLLRLLKDEDKEKISVLNADALHALNGAAEYIKLVTPGWASKFTLHSWTNGRFMRLDSCAVKAFELFSPSSSAYGGMQATVYSVYSNKCKTVAGQKLLKEWLARPLCDERLIYERQDCIDALINSSSLLKSLHSSHLDKLPDLSLLARRLFRKKARLLDCYRIAQAIRKLTPMRETVLQIANASPGCSSAVKDIILLPIVWGCEQFKDLVECVDQVVDDSNVKANGLRIKPSISPDLQKIANKLSEIYKKAKTSLAMMSDRFTGIKLDSTSQHGYVYRVTMKEEKQLRGVSGIKIIDGGKGAGMRFTDERLMAINEEFYDINAEYSRAQKELEDATVEICATYAGALTRLSSLLAVVDVLSSLAMVAISASKVHVRPTIHPLGSDQFNIKNGRHIVLDFLLPDYIPNDVNLTDTRALIVTGANMGGKSTYLRSTALISILAQMGAFVPAESAELSMVEAVHARVGAADHLSKGISTFMSEMLECAKMIKTSRRNDLVVVDEIGRGTSTFDGFGLAWGITAELINNIGCRLLVATHFTELAAMNDPPRIRAVHMKVMMQDTLTLLYKAEGGVAEQSLGIHVARMVGIDEETLALGQMEYDRLEKIEQLKRGEKQAILTADDVSLREVILNSSTF